MSLAQPTATPAAPLVTAPPSKTTPATALEAFAGDPNFMTSLARGLVVIQAFTQQNPQMTISQLKH